MKDIIERLRVYCHGHPHAKIPWPHRVLHDAAEEINQLRARNERLGEAVEKMRGLAAKQMHKEHFDADWYEMEEIIEQLQKEQPQ